MTEEKLKKLADLKKKFEKEMGVGTVMGAKDVPLEYDVISTGSIELDEALGIGGLPKGRIIEIYGPESAGKTTLASHIIAEAHKNPDSLCAFVDVEHAYDTSYAENLGVDLDRLEISQPDYGEQALEVADRLIESGIFDIVVLDSIAALVPKKELDGDMDDQSMMLQARMMSKAMRKIVPNVSKTNTLVILLNQVRDKPVMMGNPETTPGGWATKFAATIRMRISRSITKDNVVKIGEEIIGNQTTVKVIKNKVAPPFKQAEFDILFGIGIDKIGELIKIGKQREVLKLRAEVVTYGEEKYPEAEFRKMLTDNPEFYAEIRSKIMKKETHDVETT